MNSETVGIKEKVDELQAAAKYYSVCSKYVNVYFFAVSRIYSYQKGNTSKSDMRNVFWHVSNEVRDLNLEDLDASQLSRIIKELNLSHSINTTLNIDKRACVAFLRQYIQNLVNCAI